MFIKNTLMIHEFINKFAYIYLFIYINITLLRDREKNIK